MSNTGASGNSIGNPTLDPNLKSWAPGANDEGTDFPIQNLPWCVFARKADAHIGRHTHDDGSVHEHSHINPLFGVAIGSGILDLHMLLEAGELESVFDDEEMNAISHAFEDTCLNSLAELGPAVVSKLRRAASEYLRDGGTGSGTGGGQQTRRLRAKVIVPIQEALLLPPMHVGNYTDFYASVHHATNVGAMFRPDNALLPNYKHVPIGYHGRASSLVVSGNDIRRPKGQQSPPEDGSSGPVFGPCKMLDYELEVGAFIGRGNEMGEPIGIADARQHIFGLCLLNDWSARDIQKWEYQPLGPFLAKNFASSISPFVVSLEALEPFRCAGSVRPAGDPEPLAYLNDASDRAGGGFDVTLEVLIVTAKMREAGAAPARVSIGNLKDLYWTFSQFVAHHTVNGCNLQPGDLLGSGTVSGPDPASRGCLLELTWDGVDPATKKPKPRKPVQLPGGETRTFLQDGDEVIFRVWCERPGFRRIGFGECRGVILPAK